MMELQELMARSAWTIQYNTMSLLLQLDIPSSSNPSMQCVHIINVKPWACIPVSWHLSPNTASMRGAVTLKYFLT